MSIPLTNSYIVERLTSLQDKVLKVVPSAKKSEIKAEFSSLTSEFQSFNFGKNYSIRRQDGTVLNTSDLLEAARVVNIRPSTLACYLSVGRGEHSTKNWIVSTNSRLEPSEPSTEEVQNFWFLDKETGEVKSSESLEDIAKIAGIKPKTLYNYLSTGKGRADIKRGTVSKTELKPMSPADLWEQRYFKETGIWPNPSENPYAQKGRSY